MTKGGKNSSESISREYFILVVSSSIERTLFKGTTRDDTGLFLRT